MSDANETPFEFSRPVVVIPGAIEVPDLATLARLPFVAEDAMGQLELVPALVDLLERCVEGGMKGRPSSEFWQLVIEMQTQLGASRKN